MKYFQMTYFCAVCRYKTISKAAEMMSVSQPAVSVAIRELEEEFGIKLFSRKGNMLVLTDAGEVFRDSCQKILDDTELLADRMHKYGDNYVPIKIGVPPMIATLVFPTLSTTLATKHPKLALEVYEQGSLLSRKEVLDGSADMAICIIDDLTDNSLNVLPLRTTQLVYCVSHSHKYAKLPLISWSMLANENIIMLKDDSYQYRALNDKFEQYNISPKVQLHSSQLATINTFVCNGLAGAFYFKELADNDSRYVGVPIQDSIPAELGIVWKKNNRQLDNLAKVVDVIKQIL